MTLAFKPFEPLGPIGTRRRPSQRGKQTSIYLSHALFARLDAWRSQQLIVPSRGAAIRRIMIDFLDRAEQDHQCET